MRHGFHGGAGWFYVKSGLPAKPVSTLAEGVKSSMFARSELSDSAG
jgi:hypothetical protein